MILLGTHLCNLCVDTRWLAYVLRDRPDDSHGTGGLLQVSGPVADALWLQGFGVALLTLCLLVGGKQKKETQITISTRKKNEHSMPSSSHVHRTETHIVLRVQPHTFANLARVPLFPAQVVGPCVGVASVERTSCWEGFGGQQVACILSPALLRAARGAPLLQYRESSGLLDLGPLRLWRDSTPCQEWRQYRCVTTSLGHATPSLPFSSTTFPCCTSCRCLRARLQTRRSSCEVSAGTRESGQDLAGVTVPAVNDKVDGETHQRELISEELCEQT